MIYIGCHLSVTDGYKAMGEAPNEDEGYIEEIHTVKSWMEV